MCRFVWFRFVFFFFLFSVLFMPMVGAIVKWEIRSDSNARLIHHSDQIKNLFINNNFAGNALIKINKRQKCGFSLDYALSQSIATLGCTLQYNRGNWIPLRPKFLRNDLLNHTFLFLLLLLFLFADATAIAASAAVAHSFRTFYQNNEPAFVNLSKSVERVSIDGLIVRANSKLYSNNWKIYFH